MFDVIVVGGGAVGASALFALTERGVRNVLLLEQKPGLAGGATGAWGSLVRIYHYNQCTSARAVETVPYYLDFAARTGRSAGFARTGALYFRKARERSILEAELAVLNRGALRLELIEPREGCRRFPTFQWREDDLAIHESHGGYADPLMVTSSWVQAAQARGAEARTGEGVAVLRPGATSVTVETTLGQVHECRTVVLAAGAWSPALLSEPMGVESRVIQVNEFLQPGHRLEAPLFIDLDNNTFGRPSAEGTLLAGYLTDRASSQPRFVQHLSVREAHEAKQRISARFNWIKNATLQGGIRAVEGYTADSNGLLERRGNVVLAAGWSCTGFTLAPWIGQRVADLVLS